MPFPATRLLLQEYTTHTKTMSTTSVCASSGATRMPLRVCCSPPLCIYTAKLGLLKDPASFPAWSYMTAAKRCRSYLSGSGRTVDFSRLAATLPDDAGDKKSFPYSLGGSRSELVGDADACRAVEEAVCALPEAERFAVMLFFFCGLDPDQIARNLQADPRSVRRAIISGAGLVGAEIKKRTKDTPALSKFRGAAEARRYPLRARRCYPRARARFGYHRCSRNDNDRRRSRADRES